MRKRLSNKREREAKQWRNKNVMRKRGQKKKEEHSALKREKMSGL